MRKFSVLALALFAGAAFANEVTEIIAVADVNKDGSISAEEIVAIADDAQREMIVKLDVNKDGTVSAEEIAAIAE